MKEDDEAAEQRGWLRLERFNPVRAYYRRLQRKAAEQCRSLYDKHGRCEAEHGDGAEVCYSIAQQEKQCLATILCPDEARMYYPHECLGVLEQARNPKVRQSFRFKWCQRAHFDLAACMHPYFIDGRVKPRNAPTQHDTS
eukprot:TRINITY_DN62172_c0_g1_i2.p1 TRINITY_DN62172_c0_g1~~TRINITY_DN62172_c0_g1_i2.p1  ORF type:complete len:140 (-),score=55.73 TRINITY_DN62172_c0_g1_i2:312-731(-)